MLGKQRSVVDRLVLLHGLSFFGNISLLFFAFAGITGCGSASLKLCASDAVSPWSQIPSPDSQWFGYLNIFDYLFRATNNDYLNLGPQINSDIH